MTFTGGSRVTAVELNTPGLVPTVPKTTSSTGTATSGTTETFDALLGYYQFTALAGVRYMALVNGAKGSSTAGELYAFRIRDSGTAANPVATDTIVAETSWYCPATGGGGQAQVYLAGSFLVTVGGVHTIGLSVTRLAGANTCSAVGSRELFVMAVGTV